MRRKSRKKPILILFSFILLLTLVSIIAYGNTTSAIRIFVNGEELPFDVPPVNISNRLLVPIRVVMQALGADVSWDPSSRIVTAETSDTVVTVPIGSSIAYKNNSTMNLDVPAQIIEGRTFVPFRFISESLGAKVHWDSQSQSVLITQEKATSPFSIKGISLGADLEEVTRILGSPKAIEDSEYNFKWYIYHDNYRDYVQVGIKDNSVVALYSNQGLWDHKDGINVGAKKSLVNTSMPEALDGIIKGNTRYILPSFPDGTEYEVFRLGNSYVTVFYDLHRNQTVSSIKMIDRRVEEAYLRTTGVSSELKASFERQVFDLTNAARVREGLKPLVWCDIAASAATKHSRDMAENDYFKHENLRGESPFDRMKKEGIRYRAAGENLAAGQQSPIYAYEGWMNSLTGHREALLGNYTRLGVGVWLGGSNTRFNTYFTQKFYTPL